MSVIFGVLGLKLSELSALELEKLLCLTFTCKNPEILSNWHQIGSNFTNKVGTKRSCAYYTCILVTVL